MCESMVNWKWYKILTRQDNPKTPPSGLSGGERLVTELCSWFTRSQRAQGHWQSPAFHSQATQWVTPHSLRDGIPGQPQAGTLVRLRTLREKTETGRRRRLTLAEGVSNGGKTCLQAICNPSIQVSLLTHRHGLHQLSMHCGFKNGHGHLFLDSL